MQYFSGHNLKYNISCYQVQIRFPWRSQGTSLTIEISIPQPVPARQQEKQKPVTT